VIDTITITIAPVMGRHLRLLAAITPVVGRHLRLHTAITPVIGRHLRLHTMWYLMIQCETSSGRSLTPEISGNAPSGYTNAPGHAPESA